MWKSNVNVFWIFRIDILYHIYILRCIVLQPQSRAILLICNIAKMQILANLAYYIPTEQVEKYFRNIRSLLKGASKWLNHIKGAYTRIYHFYAPGKCVFRNSLLEFAKPILVPVQQVTLSPRQSAAASTRFLRIQENQPGKWSNSRHMNTFSDIDLQSFEETDCILIMNFMNPPNTPRKIHHHQSEVDIAYLPRCSPTTMKYDSLLDCNIAGALPS